MKKSTLVYAFYLTSATIALASAVNAGGMDEFGCIQVDTSHPDVHRDTTENTVPFCDIKPDSEIVQCYTLSPDGKWKEGEAFPPDAVQRRQNGGAGRCPKGTEDGKKPNFIRG